jgi:prepilin-type N-terminal cleavage/methylation domain-containing protein
LKEKSKKTGFTLIELIIVISIIVIISGPIGMFLFSLFSSFDYGNKVINAGNIARETMDTIMFDLNKYKDASTGVVSEIRLRVGVDASGNEVFYAKENGALNRKLKKDGIEIKEKEVLASNIIQDIRFTQTYPDVIDIELSVKYGNDYGKTGNVLKIRNTYRKKTAVTPTSTPTPLWTPMPSS